MDLRRLDRVPTIAAVMTPFPYSVQIGDGIDRAERLMSEHDLRHLPVQDGDRIAGVVSQRDIALLVNPALGAAEKHKIRVRHICSGDPYVVDVSTPLDQVLREMARRHLGSALVTKKGHLSGIFTTTDACRVLADILGRFRGSGGDAA